MTTDDSTTPIYALVRSDVVRSAFLAPLEANGWRIVALADAVALASLIDAAAYAVLLVDSAASVSVPGPWVQGLFMGSGEPPDGLSARPFSTPVAQVAADLRRVAFVAQLAAVRAARSHQARGFLEDVPLRSCLAALVGRKASGTLRFEGPRGRGCVFVRDGAIIDVEVASLRGEEALARLLAWTEAAVHLAEGTVLGDALITRPTDDVFAEAERMAATVAAALVLIPKPGVPLELDRFLASRIVPQMSDALEKLLDFVDGTRDIVALLDASPFDDPSTARTLARFAQGGALRAAGTTAQPADVAPPSVALIARHTPVSLPQVTIEMDAPRIAPELVGSGRMPGSEPGQVQGVSTPVGLFAAVPPQVAPTSSRAADETPIAPGVEAAESVQSANDGGHVRRTPISVETPAKAALDAAFRKAAQESQAVLAAATPTTGARRSQNPPQMNARARRLMSGIAAAALAMFAFVAVKSLTATAEPEQAARPAAIPAPVAAAEPVPTEPTSAQPDPEVPAPPSADEVVADADAVPSVAPALPPTVDAPAAVPVAAPPAAAAHAATGAPAHKPSPGAPSASVPAAPKAAGGRLQRAKDFLDQGNYVSASVEAQAIVSGDPSHSEAWLILGASAQQFGRDREARRFYGECVRIGRGPFVEDCRRLLAQ